MDIWPFRPKSDTTEIFEWLTEIIQSRSGEQRIALRPVPRVKLNFDHLLDPFNVNAAKAIIRYNDKLRAPDWVNRVSANSLILGSNNVAVSFASNVEVGDQIVVWSSSNKYEPCTVTAKTSTNITFTTTKAHTACFIMRLLNAYLIGDLSLSRGSSTLYDASLTLGVTGYSAPLPTTFTQYRSVNLCPLSPVISSAVKERFFWSTEYIDSQLGLVTSIRDRNISEDFFELRFIEFHDVQKLLARQFIYSLFGKQKSFWADSCGNDFECVQSILNTQTFIRVFKADPFANFMKPTLDICLQLKDGSKLYRRVDSITAAANFNSAETVNLNVDSALPAIALSSLKKISTLYLFRSNSDRFEVINGYNGSNAIAISIPCVEVPV